MVGEITRSDRVFIGADLSVAGVGSGIGFGDIGADAVEDFDLLELRDLELGVRQADQGDVADAQVLDRPVHDGVEIGLGRSSRRRSAGPGCCRRRSRPR